MSEYTKTKHDIGLVKQDGVSIGLMLAKKNGVPIYRADDDEYLANQMFTGTPDYAYLPPEKELVLKQDDWRAGFGQEYFDNDNPKRYYTSDGVDLRFKGMAIAGPLPTSIAHPSDSYVLASAYPTNWDMETAAAGWTNGARSNDVAKHGTFSWKLTTAGAGAEQVYQDLTWSASFQSKTAYFKAWVYTGDADRWRIFIDDGVGTTYSSYHAGGAAGWVMLTVNRTLNVAATRLRIGLECIAGAPSIGYFDDAMTPVAGIVSCLMDFDSDLYFALKNTLFKLNTTTGAALTYVGHVQQDITDMEVFASNLYLALGYSYGYWYVSTADAFTESTATNNTMKYLCTIKAAANTLYGSDTANTIRSNTNPINGGAAWSAQTTVDSSTFDIVQLITRSNVLYIRKEDRPFYLDTSGNVQVLVEETRTMANSEAGRKATIFLDDLYMPWGSQSLLHYLSEDGYLEWLDPSDFCTNAGDFVGKILATAADERYLYAILDNGTKIEVLAGREEVVDGTAIWVWHPQAEITLGGANVAYISNVYKKRLWIVSTSSSDSIYYIPLTTKFGDITNDSNYTFKTGTSFITPWLHGNFPADMKAFIKISLTIEDTTAAIYWTGYYQKLGDTSWTEIDTFKVSPTTTKYIPADATANNPKSTMIRLKFTCTTNDTTKTPILLRYDVRAILYPANRRIIAAEVICENEIQLKDGTIEHGQANNIKAAIEEARDATWPVTFYPFRWEDSNDTIYVKFLPTQMQITKNEQGRKDERHYLLRMQEVGLS